MKNRSFKELFEALYDAYEEETKGQAWLGAPVHKMCKTLKMSREALAKNLTVLMIEMGAPYIELIQPSITSPRWKPVIVFGTKYWWVKLRKLGGE